MPFVRRTRATFRSAEFGFFGVVVYTRVQTPRFCGAPRRAGVDVFLDLGLRPLRTIWLIVGKLSRPSFGRSRTGSAAVRPTRKGSTEPGSPATAAGSAGGLGGLEAEVRALPEREGPADVQAVAAAHLEPE